MRAIKVVKAFSDGRRKIYRFSSSGGGKAWERTKDRTNRHWTFSSNFFMLHVNCSLKRLFVKTHFLIKINLDVKLGSSESLGKLTRSAKISPAAKLINRNQFKSLDWKLSKTRFDYISAVAFLMAKGKANSIQSISMFRLLPPYLTPIALIIRKNDIFRVWFWRFMGYFNEELTSRSVIDLFW